MTKSLVTIFVIITMAMAITLIRAQPAHSFAIWMLTCYQKDARSQAPGAEGTPMFLTNVDPIPTTLTGEDGAPCNIREVDGSNEGGTCAECLNAIINESRTKKGEPVLEAIKVTYTSDPLANASVQNTIIQILIGLADNTP